MKLMKGILLILFVLLITGASSQSTREINVKILSLENVPYEAKITTDLINEKVVIQLDSFKSIVFYGFRDLVESPRIMGDKFLIISYKMKGGSGLSQIRSSILCITGNDLIPVFDVLSSLKMELEEVYDNDVVVQGLYDEKKSYGLKVLGLTSENGNYTLLGEERYEAVSKYNPTLNCDIQNTVEIDFNDYFKVFSNGSKPLNGDYIIGQISGDAITKYFFGEEYPVVQLKNYTYFFIEGNWYIKDGLKHLTKF